MNWFVTKCKLFHRKHYEPYIHGALYDYETVQCAKCGMIYDEIDESGNSPYDLSPWVEIPMLVLISTVVAVLFMKLHSYVT